MFSCRKWLADLAALSAWRLGNRACCLVVHSPSQGRRYRSKQPIQDGSGNAAEALRLILYSVFGSSVNKRVEQLAEIHSIRITHRANCARYFAYRVVTEKVLKMSPGTRLALEKSC